ncbi:hypothetical protein [Mycolicibacterium diernhoferi]|uniref:Lipoprotein n=1 Tax=Mycolicibacterium diernhoferi TaxID=1801 RepID=A0A1T3WP53_9MYCO|nr:hypothetical protein [Mycolicibacterium diernhoferi]OPE56184.1 hypothetical protein BV510_01230 [Mycolicibacterium diernhoferi]PEG54512.1 hypothetical protein CRI78_11290 [Mycolicibacterium diernhoferi]QYL25659.1 hypothetical protein K0O62_18235 [Mycolicibacterium diernhoferi]
MLKSWRGCAAATRLRIVALALGAPAALAMIVVGCASVTSGTATVDKADAPIYQASVSASSAESAASASARESERQVSITRKAVHSSCEALSNTSAEAITAVNGYVDAYNQSSDVAATARPAIDALNGSADQVSGSLSEPLGPELNGALRRWVDAARAVASAIATDIGPGPFNDAINQLNDSRTVALDLCDAAY